MNDFDLKFKRHPVTGDLVQRNDTNAILQSVRNLVLTATGDWKAEQGIGAGVDSLLGENFNNVLGLLKVKQNITFQLEQFEPRIELKAVDVSFTNDGHGLMVVILFLVRNTNRVLEFKDTIDVLR